MVFTVVLIGDPIGLGEKIENVATNERLNSIFLLVHRVFTVDYVVDRLSGKRDFRILLCSSECRLLDAIEKVFISPRMLTN